MKYIIVLLLGGVEHYITGFCKQTGYAEFNTDFEEAIKYDDIAIAATALHNAQDKKAFIMRIRLSDNQQ